MQASSYMVLQKVAQAAEALQSVHTSQMLWLTLMLHQQVHLFLLEVAQAREALQTVRTAL